MRSELQSVEECCRMLQNVAECCRVLQCVAAVLQCAATRSTHGTRMCTCTHSALFIKTYICTGPFHSSETMCGSFYTYVGLFIHEKRPIHVTSRLYESILFYKETYACKKRIYESILCVSFCTRRSLCTCKETNT